MLDANAALELRSGNMDLSEPPAANLESKGYREVEPPAIDLKPSEVLRLPFRSHNVSLPAGNEFIASPHFATM